jgi:4-hydroxy-tetrahydrodipicolinate synthase
LVVFQTPFHADQSIDEGALRTEIDWIYGCQADGIVMAMVSEVLRLSSEERDQLALLACELGSGRGPVVISVGAESTRVTVRHARHAEFVGADAVMAIPPVSVALGDEETLAYYEAVLEAVSLPVIVQDASAYVGRPMSIAVQAELERRHRHRVLFKPEAQPLESRLVALMEATGGRAQVFEGSGGVALLDTHPLGVVGTMPGADLCWALVELWQALEAGDRARAATIHEPLAALVSPASTLDEYLAIEKHLLVKQGVFTSRMVRGPVGFRLDPDTALQVDRRFDALKEAVGRVSK